MDEQDPYILIHVLRQLPFSFYCDVFMSVVCFGFVILVPRRKLAYCLWKLFRWGVYLEDLPSNPCASACCKRYRRQAINPASLRAH
jgi:hypothetical protein